MKKYTLFLNGGIGKHIIATTLIRQIKEEEPEARITIISGYPELFLHNPRIHRNLHHMTSYVFDDYIKGTDFRQGEPYSLPEYYNNKKHLSQLYPLAYRFKKENENIIPELYLSKKELLQAEAFIKKSKQPVITIQVTGGNQRVGQCKDPKELTPRDLPIESAQKIVDVCNKEGFNVVQIALPHEHKLQNVMLMGNVPFRNHLILIPFIKAHIGIDSAMMHGTAAFKKPALIFWGNTNSNCLGYPYMTNIHRKKCPTPMCARPRTGMPDSAPEGVWQCPHKLICQKWTPEEIEEHTTKFLKRLKEDKNVTHTPITKISLGANPAQPITANKEKLNKFEK